MSNPKLIAELLNVVTKPRAQRGYATKEAPNTIQVLAAIAEVLRILGRSYDDYPRHKAYETAATVLEEQSKRARALGFGGVKLEPVLPDVPVAKRVETYPLRKRGSR